MTSCVAKHLALESASSRLTGSKRSANSSQGLPSNPRRPVSEFLPSTTAPRSDFCKKSEKTFHLRFTKYDLRFTTHTDTIDPTRPVDLRLMSASQVDSIAIQNRKYWLLWK